MNYKCNVVRIISLLYAFAFISCSVDVASDPNDKLHLYGPEDKIVVNKSSLFKVKWNFADDSWNGHTLWLGVKSSSSGSPTFNEGFDVSTVSGEHSFPKTFTRRGEYFVFSKYSKDNTTQNTYQTNDLAVKVYQDLSVIVLKMRNLSLDESDGMKNCLMEAEQYYSKDVNKSKSDLKRKEDSEDDVFPSWNEAKIWAVKNAGGNYIDGGNWGLTWNKPILCIIKGVIGDNNYGLTINSGGTVDPCLCFILTDKIAALGLQSADTSYITTGVAIHELGHALGIGQDDWNGLVHSGDQNVECVMHTPLNVQYCKAPNGPHFCEKCEETIKADWRYNTPLP